MPSVKRVKRQPKIAIIIGAGPAGLTAAFELLKNSKIIPIVLEKSAVVGGISATYSHKGNSIDIGGHRFFSKSDRVIQWWLQFLPLRDTTQDNLKITYHGQQKSLKKFTTVTNSSSTDVMLLRNRKSSIVYQKKMFDYPLTYSWQTVQKLGLGKMIKVAATYGYRIFFPRRPEQHLEDFYINRFGDEFYRTFFQAYTEKVWGKTCTELSAEWGRQRVKGLSIARLLQLELRKRLMPWRKSTDQETSLIEQFMYPSYGPGHLWQKVAEQVTQLGGQIIFKAKVDTIHVENKKKRVYAVTYHNGQQAVTVRGDYVLSTMPVNELFRSFSVQPDPQLMEIATNLEYRDFITVGVAVPTHNIHFDFKHGHKVIKDNWLYIHDKNVKVGRIQIFNNWSPYLVAQKNVVWLGLEYFCFKDDELWQLSNKKLVEFAVYELVKLGFIKRSKHLYGKVIRVEKAYPSYTGTYRHFQTLRKFVDQFENLFLIGRNGMHKYNNQDHSMLTAMAAVENIIAGKKTKENIWSVNTEQRYHEKKEQ